MEENVLVLVIVGVKVIAEVDSIAVVSGVIVSEGCVWYVEDFHVVAVCVIPVVGAIVVLITVEYVVVVVVAGINLVNFE